MKLTLLLVSCVGLFVLTATGQTPQETPSFEVASVKPAGPDELSRKMPFLPPLAQERMRFRGGPGTKDPGRIDYSGVTLKMLLKRAYDVKAEQISGPGWLDTERYDIAAKLPPGTTAEQLRLMLQNLLTERFQIRLHREAKALPVYFLTVAKNGPKLQPPEKSPEYKDNEERKAAMQKTLASMRASLGSGDLAYNSSFHLPSATIAEFTETLSSRMDRPVVDKTHLDGVYAFTLKWSADGAQPRGDNPAGPSIFVAIEEQLGLKLQAANEQFEILVIDKAEKSPIGN
jgi:uncharacterized protein (TIGR03435 family)